MLYLYTLSEALCLIAAPVYTARKFVDRMVKHFANDSRSIPYRPDLSQRWREANRRALRRHRLTLKEREHLSRQQLSRLESQVMKFLRYGGFLRQGNLPRRFDHLESPLDVISKEIDFVVGQLEELLSAKLRQVGISPSKGLRTDQLEAELLQFWKNS
jgi:hypothetical protein